MNFIRWASLFLLVAAVAAVLGFTAAAGPLVAGVAKFVFFLFGALFVIAGLTQIFMGSGSYRH